MRSGATRFGYLKEKDCTVITLPYGGSAVHLLILLPDAPGRRGRFGGKAHSAALKRYGARGSESN